MAKKKSSSRSSSRTKKNQPVNRAAVGGVAPVASQAAPITVTANEARGDNDALYGGFAKVTKGKHQGRYGVVESFVEHNKKTGYPTKAILRTRDEDTARLTVDYDALERDVAGRR